MGMLNELCNLGIFTIVLIFLLLRVALKIQLYSSGSFMGASPLGTGLVLPSSIITINILHEMF